MKKITMLILAFIAIITSVEAQFIQQNSLDYGSKTTIVENRQQITMPSVALKNVTQSATFDSENLNIQSVGQRIPQATLLTEGFDDITTLPGAGFSFVNVSDTPGVSNWFQGNDAVFPSQAGAATAYIGANFNNTAGSVINNFMITPELNLENGDEIIFWTRTVTGSIFPDRLEVRIDPTGANTNPSGPASVGSYTELLLEINPTLVTGVYPEIWTQFTVVVAGLTGATDTRVAFRYWVTDGGPVGNNSDYIGIDSLSIEEAGGGGPFPDPYCGPIVYTSTVEPITLVDVAGISNVTDPTVNGTPDHEDFTAISGDMEEGMSYPIALEGNTDGNFTNSFTVFIDWNQDGILDNANERYEIGAIVNSTGTDGQQATGNIVVPAGVVAGTTRMRVIKKFLAAYAPDSCTPGSGFGQAEDYSMNVTTAGGGGGVCGTPILEINQDSTNTCMATITQGGLAQSYIPLEDESAGAGVMFTAVSTGLDVNLSLWDGLPNAGGTMLASGTSQTDGTIWADVFWDPVVNVTVGTTYYIVIDGDPTLPCIAGDTTNPYPDGNVFANAGYTPFPDFDYSFRTYSCDGAGGGCPIVSDCNLIDSTPDDATSPDIWDRPFADGTCCSGLGPVSYDVYGPFTVDVTGLYTVDSDQIGGWDGYMFIYETCFDPLDQTTNYVAGDDDGPGGLGTSQILDVTLTAGTEYYLITTGFSAGDFGDFVNTFTGVGTVSCGGPVVTYDDCAGAIALSCGDSVVGETLTATDSGGNAAPDVFYKFTGSGASQLITISLCGGGTDYDSALRVFDDCDLLNELAFNDDSCGLQSEVTFVSDGTSTYYIMVEGFGSNSGNFSLDVSCADPLPNDECSGAIAVSCGGSVTGSTVGATIDSGAPACGPAITSPGVWYSLNDNSGLPGDITLSLCNGTDFDSKISVYSGTCAALVCVDGNDDACGLQSEITFASDGNTQYYILIHSFGGATGNFTMDVTCTPTPPPNDMIANSIDVDEIGFPYTDPSVAMPAATTEGGNPQNCDLTGANGVWYNFVSVGDGQANASIVTPGGASSVTFYTAPDENATETDLVLVPQNTNQCAPGTSASIYTLAGQAYYVFVLNSGAITDIVIDGTNLGLTDNTLTGFSFYPNPTNGILNLQSVDNIEHVSLYNLLGQIVVNNRVEATTSQIDISGLSTGTYLMKVTVNGQTGTYKVLKD